MLHANFLSGFFLLAFKMDEKYSSETSIDFHLTTRLYVPEDRNLENYNVLFLLIFFFFQVFGLKFCYGLELSDRYSKIAFRNRLPFILSTYSVDDYL
jgi:hypothetical protein